MSDDNPQSVPGTPLAGEAGSEIRWRCPACGCYLATLKKPEETDQQATNRMIDDHIKLACSAYYPNSGMSDRAQVE